MIIMLIDNSINKILTLHRKNSAAHSLMTLSN